MSEMSRVREWFRDHVVSQLALAFLTAVTTLTLLVVLSMVFGQANAEHRIAGRCNAFEMREMIFELAESLGSPFDRSEHPALNMRGIDCSLVWEDDLGGLQIPLPSKGVR